MQYLCELGETKFRGWTLFPTGDEMAASIARYYKPLRQRFRIVSRSWEQFEWAYDKRFTYPVAASAGLNVPVTYYPRCQADLAELECTFPVILKPAFKKTFNRFVHKKGWIVNTKPDLLRRYEVAATFVDPATIMVQELIPGGGETQFSFAALCAGGEPIASLIACRRRQYPLDLGRSSTYVETVENKEVERAATQLLRATAYTGLVELEFKYDARDGRYCLLDANPRVWVWHNLSEKAGVDFPYLLWQLAHGVRLASIRAIAGIHWMRMTTDLPAVAFGLLRGSICVRDYLRSLRGPSVKAIFALDDPWPALLEIPLLAIVACQRGAL